MLNTKLGFFYTHRFDKEAIFLFQIHIRNYGYLSRKVIYALKGTYILWFWRT
nr:MAG TPA: hypothetical protein [Caudoviricetes sp.]